MSEFDPVRTKIDLDGLDENEMVSGYLAGQENSPEPGNDKSRSYWHGWRNGMVDFGHMKIDSAMAQLAREVVGRHVN